MTKKEIEIQIALGTIEPHNLSKEEFNHWVGITAWKYCQRQKERDARRKAEGKLINRGDYIW